MPLTKAEQDKINLRSGEHILTNEERSRGGKRSSEVKREKKAMRELANLLNKSRLTKEEKERLKDIDGLDESMMTKQMVFIHKLYTEAMTGNVKAMKLWIEISDDLEEKKKELEIEKLRAEVEAMKRDRGQGSEAPTFIYKFDDFSMDDGDNG